MSDFSEAISQDAFERFKRDMAFAESARPEVERLPQTKKGILEEIRCKSDFQPGKGWADVSRLTVAEAKAVELHIEGGLSIGAAIGKAYGMDKG